MNTPNWTELQKLTTINQLAIAAHENAKEKGFHDDGLTNSEFLERTRRAARDDVRAWIP